MELAEVLRALGSEVTLMALEERPLWAFDPLVGETLIANRWHQGIDLHLGLEVAALELYEGGIVVAARDGQPLTGFDTLIWAVGRSPNTGGLGLDAAGVETPAPAASSPLIGTRGTLNLSAPDRHGRSGIIHPASGPPPRPHRSCGGCSPPSPKSGPQAPP